MILIVDDKVENIFSLRRTLELAGFEIDSAESGDEALRKILKQDYSLIILDVQMPGMDGFEVAEALQGVSKAADIPIIFLSAVSTEKRFITKGYQAGAVDYVVKPVDPDIFILKVQTLNRLYEQNRELNAMRKTLLGEVAVRRKAEKELSIRVEELRTTLHSIPQIAFTLAADGKLEFYNEHWERVIGPDEELPMPHPDDAETLQRLQKAIDAGNVFQEELRIRTLPDGDFRCHLLHVIPVEKEGKILKWVGTLTDVHDRKTANDLLEAAVKTRTTELLQKNRELEENNTELQQFASVASHDLKEPLRKIQVFGSIMRHQAENVAPEIGEGITRLMGIAERMSNLINDLLNYSRLSVTASFQPTPLEQIVQEVISDFEFAIEEKGAQINVGRLPTIDAIPGQMRQLFQNLISNSLKFSRTGIPTVIDISCVIQQSLCSISISDNGIGFDEAYLPKIFTIFQRLNAPGDYEGTGIGLAIVKKIVEKHGGEITAKSTQQTGSTFIILLPIRQPSSKIPSIKESSELSA